ncbi:plasmid mobilization relaxosome protein MobC [Hyphomicrobium sp. LHD-15]|uniref:plasmid mobilization relaxosome protein MobC n=1 Tax=Hyphomicrobium sp. LHD-15 TaxID=3072142 RepID=UPI00280D7E30|nr:plasmid mobilization relaxosome protein MobC [Hyphomicrobium sp. LHD-15]MDQ8699272.1 plasmid mobilization relaxosome protein MobC [Hyphomicrobium sp. LHD-15]
MPTRGYRKGQSDSKEPLPRFVRTRLSDQDYAALNAEAVSRSVKIANLTRAVLAAHLKRQRAELPHPRGLESGLLREFSRIGNNLNQLARQANVGLVAVPADEVRACIDRINALARTM